MQVGDVVRMKCGGEPMVVIEIADETATCRWPHPRGRKPFTEDFPIAALEPVPPKSDVADAWLAALKATEEFLRGELR